MHHIKYLVFVAVFAIGSCAPKMAKETGTGAATTADKTFRSTAPKPGPARPIEIGESHQFTLANGLKVIVVENHKLPVISYQLAIDRDIRLEKEKTGLPEFTGTLIGTGSTTKT